MNASIYIVNRSLLLCLLRMICCIVNDSSVHVSLNIKNVHRVSVLLVTSRRSYSTSVSNYIRWAIIACTPIGSFYITSLLTLSFKHLVSVRFFKKLMLFRRLLYFPNPPSSHLSNRSHFSRSSLFKSMPHCRRKVK